MPRDRDEKGRYSTDIDRADVLEHMDPGEPYSASEISEQLDLAHSTAHHYLSDLHEQGDIEKKKMTERAVVWIRPDSDSDD